MLWKSSNSSNRIKEMIQKNTVEGLENIANFPVIECEGCALGKMKKLKFPQEGSRAEEILDLVHSDVMGPLPLTKGGAKYMVTFIDDYSKYCTIYLIKSKNEVFCKFVEFLNYAERHTGRKLKTLRSDNGGEYCNKQFDEFLKNKGITHQKTVPYNPEQNGVAERKNGVLMECVRSIMYDMKVEIDLWGEAINYANYI